MGKSKACVGKIGRNSLADRDLLVLADEFSVPIGLGIGSGTESVMDNGRLISYHSFIMRLQAFIRDNGSIPFEEWLERLDSAAAARVIIAQARLTSGNTSNVKWFGGIGEYKINWGPGYRIYLVQDGVDLIILFAGGTKKSQQADIDLALMLNQEYQCQKQQVSQERAAASPPALELINPKKRRKKR